MRITHNGEARETDATTLGELLGPLPASCAVALNGEVVRRAHVAARQLREGDRVEVVTAVAGG